MHIHIQPFHTNMHSKGQQTRAEAHGTVAEGEDGGAGKGHAVQPEAQNAAEGAGVYKHMFLLTTTYGYDW